MFSSNFYAKIAEHNNYALQVNKGIRVANIGAVGILVSGIAIGILLFTPPNWVSPIIFTVTLRVFCASFLLKLAGLFYANIVSR